MGGWGSDDDRPTTSREARLADNSVRLTGRLQELIEAGVADRDSFIVSIELLCELHAIALAGEPEPPGLIRRVDNEIVGGGVVVLFQPPSWQEVDQLLVEACQYIHAQLAAGRAIHAAAYALWRFNWIHPFGADGNGRTARAVAYAVLCVGFGRALPGRPTVDEQIRMNRYPYWDALRAADHAWQRGELDVSAMEDLLGRLIQRQLEGA